MSTTERAREVRQQRSDPNVARDRFTALYPDATERQACAELLFSVISRAAATAPDRWGVTLRLSKKIHLNVGTVTVCGLYPNQVWVPLVQSEVDDETRAMVEASSVGTDAQPYKSIPGVLGHWFPASAVAAHLPTLTRVVGAVVDRAAQTSRQLPWRDQHSPGVLAFLEEFLGRSTPRPTWTPGRSTPRDELSELLDEFVASYLPTPDAQRHLAAFDVARDEGRRNFADVLAAQRAGEDITDLVLVKLLPHAATEFNKQRGAWCPPPAAINKDIKKWFEGAGWKNPDEWPLVSQAIIELLSDAVSEDPLAGPRAMAKFAALPFTRGLQPGMLSPILNALAPDRYALVNPKVAKCVAYFFETRVRLKMADYAATNAQLLELVDNVVSPMLFGANLHRARESEIFDLFCHWLVAIKRWRFDDDDPDELVQAVGDASATIGESIAVDAIRVPRAYTLDDAAADLFIGREKLEEMVSLLRRKKNFILEGPPGVGKTFVARRLANVLSGRDDLEGVELIQFHQSYGYEDFVQGYKPTSGGGFERKNGVFFEICERARVHPDRPHVMVIDEINRGNLSRILGELMLLIEGDKRGPSWRVKLAYATGSDEPFFVPENVYVIGTMNTADRSLAVVDYALRRRFSFYFVEPAFGLASFDAHLAAAGASPELITRIGQRMQALNIAIRKAPGLGRGYQIGHSYFCGLGDGQPRDEAWYRTVVKYEIAPLLNEYWFDSPDTVQDHIDALLG